MALSLLSSHLFFTQYMTVQSIERILFLEPDTLAEVKSIYVYKPYHGA